MVDRRHPEFGAEFHDGHDRAAKIEHALDMRRSIGNAGYSCVPFNLLNAENVDAVEFLSELKRQKLTAVRRQPDLLVDFFCGRFNCCCHSTLLNQSRSVLQWSVE